MKTRILIIVFTLWAQFFFGQKLTIDSLEQIVERTMIGGLESYFITKNLENKYLSNNEIYRFIHLDTIWFSLNKALSQKQTVTRLNISNQTHLDYCKRIGELTELEYLNISRVFTAKWGNYIREIPAGVFELNKLKVLIANNTNFKNISKKISKLENIEVLSLRNGSLKELPSEIFNLKKLKILDLSNNEITRIPEEIGNLSELQILILSGNPLEASLPNTISKCTKLELISFNLPRQQNGTPNTESLNYLSFIPNLRFLILAYSNLETAPKELQNFQNLKYLSLKGNYQLDLSKTFTELSKIQSLELLDLSFSRIKSIPHEIGLMTNLKTIYLGNYEYCCPLIDFYSETPYNNITTLPEEIVNLTQLKNLYFWQWKVDTLEQLKIQKLLPHCHIEFESKRPLYEK